MSEKEPGQLAYEAANVRPWSDEHPTMKATWAAVESAIRAAALEEAREQVAAFMILHGFATGHGDTLVDLLAEMGAQMKERRAAALEEAAKVAAGWLEAFGSVDIDFVTPRQYAVDAVRDIEAAIRALKEARDE